MGKEKEMTEFKRKPNIKEKITKKINKLVGNKSPVAKAVGLEKGNLVDKTAEKYNKIHGRDMAIERAKELEKERKKKKDSKAGGGKVKSKFFTGGIVNPSYGGEFDDR
jgi:hypothetical protein